MQEKIIIYSALTRLWGNKQTTRKPHGSLAENGSGKLRDFSPEALAYIRSLGTTHIWYIGLLEHATKTDYSSYGIHEFDALIKRTHRAGLRVLMDFIPNHVARTYHSDACPKGVEDLGATDDVQRAFSPSNNFYYLPDQALTLPLSTESSPYREYPARATGNDCFSPYPSINDWYETVKLNYGVDYCGGSGLHADPIPDTWVKMRDILCYWAGRGVDGFRCDMTELVPPAFWAWAIPSVREQYPQTLFLAEIYQPHRYGEYLRAGFDYLYDKVGVYDFLIALGKGERDAADFTAVRDAVGGDQAAMCYFTENHDEQRLASDFVFSSARQGFLATAVAALSGGNPLLLYFGQELGEQGMDTEGFSGRDGRTTIFDYWSLDKLQRLEAGHYTTAQLTEEEARLLSDYQRLATCYTDPIISSGTYYGLRPEGEGKAQVLAFVRSTSEGLYLIVANFAPTTAEVTLPLSADFFSVTGHKEGTAYRAIERMTEAVDYLCLTPLAPLRFTLTPHALKVYRLTAV